MMGTQPDQQQSSLFSYHINLERRMPADHLLRRIHTRLDLSFVLPLVRHTYGRSGHISLDPRVIVKMLLLLFLYNIRSERELMEQIAVRMDFLWFLGFDLETAVPDHSVLSKARARWGSQVFEKLFQQTVRQCVEAGLVEGRLLHVDSTMVKANAHRDSVVPSGSELVSALRQAYQQQEAKLQVLAEPGVRAGWSETQASGAPKVPGVAEASPAEVPATEPQEQSSRTSQVSQAPVLRVVRRQEANEGQTAQKVPTPNKLPVNRTHVSTTDPDAELARSKNGVTELNYKEHRLVDDAQGVITAVRATTANIADGSQLPGLYEQHRLGTGLGSAQPSIAGDHHYGTADNYLYCLRQGIGAHMGEVSAAVEERGKIPASEFIYEPDKDRLRCRQGHYLVWHQQRPEAQANVYLIEDAATCAACPIRQQCTSAKRGRSIQRHVQADLLERARTQARSQAARYSRKRRQHVMEGSFADAVNNHGARKARWRRLWRQQIQSWFIAAVQNLRILLRRGAGRPLRTAGAVALQERSAAVIASVLRRLARRRRGPRLDLCQKRKSEALACRLILYPV